MNWGGDAAPSEMELHANQPSTWKIVVSGISSIIDQHRYPILLFVGGCVFGRFFFKQVYGFLFETQHPPAN